MERLCASCARWTLGTRLGGASTVQKDIARRMSTTSVLRNAGGDENRPRRPPPRLAFRKTAASDPGTSPNATTGARPPPAPVLRRSGTPAPSGPRFSGSPGNRMPPGPVLRRTAPRRTGGPGGAPRPGGPRAGRPMDKRIRRANERQESKDVEAEEEDDDQTEGLSAQVEAYINTVIDPPDHPTEEVTHVPGQDMSIESLRADWPNTPLSATGLTESVQQRIEWLAHRIPHGYQTPNQLADRYAKGYLTRFESEAERDQVLAIAADMAQTKAVQAAEQEQTGAQPQDMTFDDLTSRPAERQGLANAYVRGQYPEVQKQSIPFLDQVVRNLNNNETYHAADTDRFMETVQGLISQSRPQPRKRN